MSVKILWETQISWTCEDDILDGMDSLLSILEESSELEKKLQEYFWKKVGNAVKNIILFWTLDSKEYFLLKNVPYQDFSSFFKSLDFWEVSKQISKKIPESFLDIASEEFRASIWDIIWRYKIFEDILSHPEEYKEIAKIENFVIYQSKSWEYFLKIWANYIPESNFSDKYYKQWNMYLFFQDKKDIYIFDFHTGSVTHLLGELEDSIEIWEKIYIHSSYPDSQNTSHTQVYCLEDDWSYENTIDKNNGFIFWVTEVEWRICAIESSSLDYIGFHKWEKVVKWKNTIRVKDIYSWEILAEIWGVYQSHRNIWKKLYVTTREACSWEINGKFKNSHYESILIVENAFWEDFGYKIPEHNIYEKIDTPKDTLYIIRHSEFNFSIISIPQWYSIGNWYGYASISKIDSIEYDKDCKWACIIHFTYSNGKKWSFKSYDYPNINIH